MYLSEIEGFRDHECGYEIIRRIVEDSADDNDIVPKVYQPVGWDINSRSDEINVVRGNLYVNKENAEHGLAELRKKYPRREWETDVTEVDKCYWKDGFIRV